MRQYFLDPTMQTESYRTRDRTIESSRAKVNIVNDEMQLLEHTALLSHTCYSHHEPRLCHMSFEYVCCSMDFYTSLSCTMYSHTIRQLHNNGIYYWRLATLRMQILGVCC